MFNSLCGHTVVYDVIVACFSSLLRELRSDSLRVDMLSYSAPPTPAPVHVPRGPLSPSTTVSPLVTPNNTLGGRPGFHKRRPSQATLILSQIASRSPVQHSRTGQSTPKRQSREMSDYFDQKPQDGAHTPRAEELHCGEKPSRVVLQRSQFQTPESVLILLLTYTQLRPMLAFRISRRWSTCARLADSMSNGGWTCAK